MVQEEVPEPAVEVPEIARPASSPSESGVDEGSRILGRADPLRGQQPGFAPGGRWGRFAEPSEGKEQPERRRESSSGSSESGVRKGRSW